MNNFNLKKYLTENKLITESPASNLELKRLAKMLFTKFKNSGARVKLGTDVGIIDQDGKTDQWDDIVQALGDHDAHINYGIRAGKEGLHLSLVGDKANSLQDEIKAFINQGDVEIYEYPAKIKYTDSEGQKRETASYFIAPGKSMSESTLNEEEGFVEVSQDEIKMHLDQFRNGNIDGDDLAQAIEEIVFGRNSSPSDRGFNTRYGQ
tara:strand:- start:47 stop:667 length:621 start_codon:yes stop_codon:yes gene_type:complete